MLYRGEFIRELLKKDLAARVKQYIDNHYKDILPIAAITFLIANTLLNDLPKLFTLSAKRFDEINTICQGYTAGPRVLLLEGPTSSPIKPLGSIQEAETATARFTLRHDRGRDDEKASKFYKEIARHFSFSKQKIVFIIVPHMVHTLPYFIESLTHIGAVIAIIPKSPQYVHGVETSLNTIYKSIIRRDINKQILSCEPDKVRVFLQDIFDQFKDCQLMILDHGGYFAPCLDILKEFSSRISGVVEHTWNGDIRYQKELGKLPTPIPIFSIARSYLKAHEDAYVAASIVDTMRAVIFSANGLNQDLTRLQIGIIGYGHIGEAVARYLLKTDVPSGNIMICDSNPARLASAKEILSLVVCPEINPLLEQCDVIIAAASEQILGRAQFSHMRAGTCVICVTSSDDQFESDAKADLTKMSRKAYITTYRHTNGKKIHLACDGKSVNFCIGSTSHPILHAVLASDCVSAFYCATNHRPLPSSTIRSIPEEQFQAIENIYKRIFDGLLSGLETLRRAVSETSYIPGRGLNALLSAPGLVKPVLLSRPSFAELEKRIPSTTAEAKKPIQLR